MDLDPRIPPKIFVFFYSNIVFPSCFAYKNLGLDPDANKVNLDPQRWDHLLRTSSRDGAVNLEITFLVSLFRIQMEDNRCPVCRTEIDNVESVYIS
jgi:hypothetical protein